MASYVPYDGSFSNTYVQYCKDIVVVKPFSDHVLWRSDQYNYALAVGDLIYANGVIRGDGNVKIYLFSSSSGYNNSLTYQVFDDYSFSLTPGDNLVYSSVGYYPTLYGGESIYAPFLVVSAAIIIFSSLLSRIFCRKR